MTTAVHYPKNPTVTAAANAPANTRTLTPQIKDEPVNTLDFIAALVADPEIAARRSDRRQIEPDNPRPPDDRAADELDELDELDDSIAARRPVARCADGNGTLSALFFSDNVNDISRAKAMCGLCPLQAECLTGALEREEPWGVWGGELLSGGRIVANKRPCGRPPKNPRPEVIFDEMGPVGSVA